MESCYDRKVGYTIPKYLLFFFLFSVAVWKSNKSKYCH